MLAAIAASVLPAGVTGAALARQVEGWEALLDRDALTSERIAEHGDDRGAGLFGAAARVLGAEERNPVAAAGRGWALTDLWRHLSDPGERDAVRAAALPALVEATAPRWSREGRALGALAHLARLDLAPSPPGAPARVARIAWHRLTGR